ncbi:MAG: glycerophosphodiester phosphodiesterase family protein, partial [Acidobacteriota bacterium]
MTRMIRFVFILVFALANLSDAQNRTNGRVPAPVSRALVIAHRGGAKETTENTIAAFQRALRLGANGVETDVRLTRDGVVVIYHDERFGRVEGLAPAQRTRLVADMTYKELSAQTLVPVGED